MSLCATMYRYFARNTCTYLLLYVSLSCCIFSRITCIYCAGFCAGFCASFCAGFCAGFCAVESPSAQTHRRRMAVASPSHRRIASAPNRVAARNAGDLPTSLELHMPVVQPTRSTRTEKVEPQKRALGEAMMRTHVR
jgi:hypothetical protein